MVQVNLGNNEGWDTHGDAFWRLKEKLFPPTDRALSALLDDLVDTGLLDSTMIAMGGEFGRTPKISGLPEHYSKPGRDHWGAVQTLFFAGGGIKGGQVIGATDAHAAEPVSTGYSPADVAATIYSAIGIRPYSMVNDFQGRPRPVLEHGRSIPGLL